MAKPRSKPQRAAGASARGGTLGSRRRPPDQARESLLSAADRLFYEQGLRAVGVDTIAAAAGVTKRTLYYHFPAKEALVVAYLQARDDATRLSIEHATEGLGPGARILALFEYLERWFSTSAYRGCPFNNAAAEAPGPEAAEIVRRHKAVMRDWLSNQAQLGGAQKPAQLGAELLLLIDGALNGALVFGSAEPARAARRVASLLLEQAGVELAPKPSRGKRP